MNRTLGATALLLCSVIGSLLALAAAIDLMAFLMTHQPGKVSDPLQSGKLWTLLCCFVVLAVLLLATSIRLARASPVQESVAGWSPYAAVVYFLVSGYLLQVYYPLPSHPHHLDKLLFILGGLIIWGMWLNFWPVTLERVLDSRGYDRIKAALIIILVFVVFGEIAFRLADPIWQEKGCSKRSSLRPLLNRMLKRKVQSGTPMHRVSGIESGSWKSQLQVPVCWPLAIHLPGEWE